MKCLEGDEGCDADHKHAQCLFQCPFGKPAGGIGAESGGEDGSGGDGDGTHCIDAVCLEIGE